MRIGLAHPRAKLRREGIDSEAEESDYSSSDSDSSGLSDELARLGFEDDDWIGGCVRCRTHLVSCCADAGFAPTIRHTTDDYVVTQNLVARGLGVTVLPASALAGVVPPEPDDSFPLASSPSAPILASATSLTALAKGAPWARTSSYVP